MIIDTAFEQWDGSAVIRVADGRYARRPAAAFVDKPARLTPRQGVFYRNLIRIAEMVGPEIPVDFDMPVGRKLFLDRGCIKIAEHAGFIAPLINNIDGVVSTITVAWSVKTELEK